MKKLFALVLIFALLLSGCGKTEEHVVEPNEEPSEIENSETEEISEEFVEEIIINFGAEKLEEQVYKGRRCAGVAGNAHQVAKQLLDVQHTAFADIERGQRNMDLLSGGAFRNVEQKTIGLSTKPMAVLVREGDGVGIKDLVAFYFDEDRTLR